LATAPNSAIFFLVGVLCRTDPFLPREPTSYNVSHVAENDIHSQTKYHSFCFLESFGVFLKPFVVQDQRSQLQSRGLPKRNLIVLNII
jgi:hypothetical protein